MKKVEKIIYRWIREDGTVDKQVEFEPWARNPHFAYRVGERSEDFMKLVDGRWGYCFSKSNTPVFDGSSFQKKDGSKITRQIEVIEVEEAKKEIKEDDDILAEAVAWFIAGGDVILASRANFHGKRKHLTRHWFWMPGFNGSLKFDDLKKSWFFETSDGRRIENDGKFEIGTVEGFLSFTVAEGQSLRIKIQKV